MEAEAEEVFKKGEDMKIINKEDYIYITEPKIVSKGSKLDILSPSEVIVKDKTKDYITIESSIALAVVNENGRINLNSDIYEVTINKGQEIKITLALTDYFQSVVIKY